MKIMKEYETIKVYGKTINRWTAYDEIRGREITTQIEVEYKEYDSTGKLVGAGTEDFTRDRWDSQTNDYELWGWDGNHYNKGGHKYFDRLISCCHINRKDVYKLRQIAPHWFPKHGYTEYSVRGF